MSKIKSLKELIKITSNFRGKIGLITGCFDVLHYGHIDLLTFAKKHVDILIIGLEGDEAIKINKGSKRPYFDEKNRARVIAALEVVNYVFIIKHKFKYNLPQVEKFYEDIWKQLHITHVFSNIYADRFVGKRKTNAKNLGVKLILHKKKVSSSSSSVIQKLGL